MQPPLITILSDFGSQDAYVGIMKGVILSRCPQCQCVDLTHEVPPQDIVAGALLLRSAVVFFPPGTVHLAIVDPGVGSERAPVIIGTERATFVGPDNGLLSLAVEACGGPARVWRIGPDPGRQVSRTFHGRDVFAPAAARLAAGSRPDELGSELSDFHRLALPLPQRRDGKIAGEVIYVDRFGNLITNVSAKDLDTFPTLELSVSVGSVAAAPLVNAYAQVNAGEPLAILNSWDMLEIAIRNGNAADRIDAGRGSPVVIAPTTRA